MSQPLQRNVLRPEHFSVAPSLLGLPLATPWPRLFALLIDLLLVAILVRAGGGILLGLAAAYAFFRFASRRGPAPAAMGGSLRPVARKRMWLMRFAGAFALFLVAKGAWNRARTAGVQLAGMATGASMTAAPARPGQSPTVGAAVGVAAGLLALERAENRDDARDAAGKVVTSMRAAGSSESDIRHALEESIGDNDHPWMADVVREVLPEPRSEPAESLAVWHAAAVLRGDTVAVDSLRPRLASALARDSLDQLRARVTELQKARDDLRQEADRAEHRGLLASIFQLLDELGIGFGWTGLYFTAFTSLWRGQTPGKRLMGIRVLRLDGEPMTLWASFERFGGYAAGLLTGLLGFAQVFWDRNRQAIHDKISETVVVRDTPPPPPPPPAAGDRRGFRPPA